MDKYVQVLKGACDGDRNVVLNVSKEIGFLTGYESKVRIIIKTIINKRDCDCDA